MYEEEERVVVETEEAGGDKGDGESEREVEVGGTVREFRKRLSGNIPALESIVEVVGGREEVREGKSG